MFFRFRRLQDILIVLPLVTLLCGIYLGQNKPGVFGDKQSGEQGWGRQHQSGIGTLTEVTGIKSGGDIEVAIPTLAPRYTKKIVLSPAEEELVVEMSAYTSRVEETDDSPCISADGTNICEYDGCVVASNDYDFGTKIIVDGFGECEVKDRMNRRYSGTGNMDIYFKMDLEGALEFGRQQVKISIAS